MPTNTLKASQTGTYTRPAGLLRATAKPVIVTVLLLVEVVPLVWLLLGSLKTQDEFLTKPAWSLPEHFRFHNYLDAWTTGRVAQSFANSGLVVFPALLLTVALGTSAAFALAILRWRGQNAVLVGFVAGIMVPGQMILLPLFTVFFKIGLSGTLFPLIITYTATGLPLTVFLMTAYFRAAPAEVFEAATLDGAGIFRALWSIGVPMMKSAIFTVTLVQFFFYWNDLLFALTFINDDSLQTVQLALLNFTGSHGSVQFGPLFAAISINVAVILVIFLFLNQRVMKGLTAGAIKG